MLLEEVVRVAAGTANIAAKRATAGNYNAVCRYLAAINVVPPQLPGKLKISPAPQALEPVKFGGANGGGLLRLSLRF